ncbi:MAG: N-acetylmuramoyl-L-alanine amidase [Pseudomonadota bacterium]
MTEAPIWVPSPNFAPRRGGAQPGLIVLHYTAMQTCDVALARLCDPAAEVSAHYLISETGEIFQLVDEAQRAWHAGQGRWHEIDDVNSHSIGIELANTGNAPFPEPQMSALEDLITAIMQRHGVAPEGVIGHSDMAPGRKSDPGPHFDWLRLERQGLAHGRGWRDYTGPVDHGEFRRRAAMAGYTAEVDDKTLLKAVRLRYRSHAQGKLTAADFKVLSD